MRAHTEVRRLIRRQFAKVGVDECVVHSDLPPDDFEFREVVTALGDLDGKRLLDVGCGKGRMMAALAERGARVVGVDPVQLFVSQILRTYACGDDQPSPLLALAGESECLPFADASFDGVICVEALEHVPDTSRALAELVRVLRVGGRLVIIDKNIYGLDRKWLVPVAGKKWWLERCGRWMYPADFPFREKWFRPQEVRALLAQHCRHVEVHYLASGRMLIPLLFRTIPQAHQYVSWRAIK